MKGLQRSISRGPKGKARIVKDVIVLDGKTISVSSTGVTTGFGAQEIFDFPEGNLLVLGLGGTIGFAGNGADANLSDTWSGNFALGTAPTPDNSLTGAEVDLVASTVIGAATAEVIAAVRVVSALDPTVVFDNTDGSLELNLNLLINAADIVDDQTVVLTLSGRIEVSYVILGDD